MTFKKLLTMAAAIMMAGSMWASDDVTNTYLTNANLSTVNSGWTYYSDAFKYTDWRTDGDVPVVEFYSQWNAGDPVSITQKDFKFSQTVTLPAGYYRLAVNAFYRNGRGDGTNEDKAWIFVKGTGIDKSQNVAALTSAGVASYTGSSDLYKAANAFSLGDFSNEFDFSLESATEVEIGFQGFFNLSLSWCILGPVKLYEYTAADYMDDYRTKVAAAEALYSVPMNSDVLAALQTAVVEESTLTTVDDVIAATNTLNGAITDANNSIKAYANAKAYLDEATKILAGTNVYTAEAYATYYTDPKAKYDAQTLTNAEANALVKTSIGWHSANTIDDILLSAWTIGGTQCKDFTTALYINTWSVEGNTDGSEFLAPFFEYWTGDDASLGANTIQAKVTGLKPNGTYSFTIRARVRQTNDKTKIAEGITMKVGDGTAVDISSGAQFNGGVFYIGNFSAMGQADSDGTLTATITVAANSNISWLSFYNAKYTEGEDLSAYIADYEFALANVNKALADNTDYAAMQTELKATATTYATVDNTDKAALIAAKEALEAALDNYNTVVGPLKGNNISEWTTTGNNGKFEVNTWSGEGNSDGSNMKTPFIQNWIGKGTNLINATMTHTVTGLTPGYYKVTALVRTLNEAGGSTPAGSFIFANDNIERAYGDNATACTNGVYSRPVVYGLVGTDGKLSIGIKVMNANFNWVSFKNFTYEFVGTELTADIAANQTEEKRVFTYVENDEAYQAAVATLEATATDANYVAAGKAIADAYALAGTEYKVETSVGAEGYATIILPSEQAVPAGLTANVATVNGTEVELTAVTKIEANKPYVLANTGSAAVSATFVGIGEAKAKTNGALTGVYESTEAIEGTYVLQNQDGKYAFYIVESAKPTITAYHAYLTAPSAGVKAFGFDAIATAITELTEKTEATEGVIYNLQGQRVNTLQRGINIVNGKKVLVK